ncbi:NucA/NucB deoxyribonuclease domain-containing protein [[Kitasatospora] papulosa]|uniref:NucA/NucB deoxyribonuclease domain-containing protein n=1 Tax=[Kitasatospora] papulosa TaxID=1464011 RepID=UPI003694212F
MRLQRSHPPPPHLHPRLHPPRRRRAPRGRPQPAQHHLLPPRTTRSALAPVQVHPRQVHPRRSRRPRTAPPHPGPAPHPVQSEQGPQGRRLLQNRPRATQVPRHRPAHPAPAGQQCDDYPFASTLEGAGNLRPDFSVKSIPAGDNRVAGGMLRKYYVDDRILAWNPALQRPYQTNDRFYVQIL